MDILKNRLNFHSIRSKLYISIILFTLPLITLLIYNNFYAIGVVRNQVADSYTKMMNLYINQIDVNLGEVDKYLNKLAALDPDLLSMDQASSDYNYDFSKLQLYNKLVTSIPLYKSMDSFFIYAREKNEMLQVNNTVDLDSEQSNRIRLHIQQMTRSSSDGRMTNNWDVQKIGEHYYLFRVIKSGSLYVGAWADASRLMIPLSLIEIGQDGTSIFVDDKGEPMTPITLSKDNGITLKKAANHFALAGNKHDYLIVAEPSQKGNFSLVALIPEENILEQLPYLQRMVTIISLASLIILPVAMVLLRKTILVPLNRLMTAMKRIREGKLETRIASYPTSYEFEIVNDMFNHMMSQIKQLRIDIYEEQLSNQKEEMQRLQLQINPHFFMNALNILYNLAKVKNYELTQEMSLCLIQYFRFMFRGNLTFVKLKDELEHTRNYLRIQELRYPGNLTSVITAPTFLLDTNVPPLIIQTFVENAIKHAVTLDEPISISIIVDVIDFKGNICLKVLIYDTGKGFPEDRLVELQAGRKITTEHGEHIGIWNVQRRLRLLYKDWADIQFTNRYPSGAAIEMILPLHLGISKT